MNIVKPVELALYLPRVRNITMHASHFADKHRRGHSAMLDEMLSARALAWDGLGTCGQTRFYIFILFLHHMKEESMQREKPFCVSEPIEAFMWQKPQSPIANSNPCIKGSFQKDCSAKDALHVHRRRCTCGSPHVSFKTPCMPRDP